MKPEFSVGIFEMIIVL